jgi:peptide/nickel transport system substrate-binding protein
MKNLFVIIAFPIVLGIAACGGASGSSPQSGPVSAADNTPREGGTLTIVSSSYSFRDPVGWNIHTASSISAVWWLNPVQEYLIQGDFLRKGPRGTNENGFNLNQAEWPADLLTGWLLESWEWSDELMGVSMKIRKGVMWQPNTAMGMAERELTAEDVASWINNYRSSPKYDKIVNFTNENCAEVTGENTVFVHFTQPFAGWGMVLAYAVYANVYPPEQTKLEKVDWEQVTGTGPFYIKNFTTGIGVTYGANANWWAGNTEIGGKTYKAPFVETLNLPILGDSSTALSALISGEVDIMVGVPVSRRETLKASCPGLNIKEAPSGSTICLVFNGLSGPTSSLDFRRALMIGTDNDSLTALVEGGVKGGFPFSYTLGESIYTSIDKLPDDVKELYSYNPEKATRMIRDAGFAGETLVLTYSTNDNENFGPIAETLEDQWSKLGIKVQLNLVDSAVVLSYDTSDGTNWNGVFIKTSGNSKTSRAIESERNKEFLPCHTDKYFNDRMDQMMREPDPAIRDVMMKEDAIYFMRNVEEFGLVETTALTCWWPWVKNYYGETDSGGTGNIGIIAAYAWIDPDLKKSMGF